MNRREDIEHHIRYKMQVGELPAKVGLKMLDELQRYPVPGTTYASLYEEVMFPDPPRIVYHTAPTSARAQILERGLVLGDGSTNWGDVGQPMGIYVGPEPDEIGKWAFAFDPWDIWEVVVGVPWQHDRMNPGCWVLTQPVPPTSLRYLKTCTSRLPTERTPS